jgi:hypothetical protein
MHTLLLIAALWVALAVPVALLIGRGLRIADQRHAAARTSPRTPDFVPAEWLDPIPSRPDAA